MIFGIGGDGTKKSAKQQSTNTPSTGGNNPNNGNNTSPPATDGMFDHLDKFSYGHDAELSVILDDVDSLGAVTQVQIPRIRICKNIRAVNQSYSIINDLGLTIESGQTLSPDSPVKIVLMYLYTPLLCTPSWLCCTYVL